MREWPRKAQDAREPTVFGDLLGGFSFIAIECAQTDSSGAAVVAQEGSKPERVLGGLICINDWNGAAPWQPLRVKGEVHR
jgi:hypothetical protein